MNNRHTTEIMREVRDGMIASVSYNHTENTVRVQYALGLDNSGFATVSYFDDSLYAEMSNSGPLSFDWVEVPLNEENRDIECAVSQALKEEIGYENPEGRVEMKLAEALENEDEDFINDADSVAKLKDSIQEEWGYDADFASEIAKMIRGFSYELEDLLEKGDAA